MNIVLMGTGEFAVPALRALAKVAHIQAVYTQPDRPAGRGLHLGSSPVKQEAVGLNLDVWQPQSLSEPSVAEHIRQLKPDAIIVSDFGQLVPQAILDLSRLGAINLHSSLLPQYRGAAPIHWAIINGEKQTGVTTFFMDASMDTGPLLLQRAIRIEVEDNALTLESKLAQVGALLVLETLDLLAEERLRAVRQDDHLASVAPKLTKQDGQINWNKSAPELFNLVRGTNPYPGAFSFANKTRLKVHTARVADDKVRGNVGEIVGLTPDTLLVQTGQGVLELLEVQPASKPRMSAGDFARGYRLTRSMVLGGGGPSNTSNAR